MIPRNFVEIGMTPRIHGHRAGLEVGPVPSKRRRRWLDQRGQTLIGVWIGAVVEIIEVERSGEAFNLDLRRLHLRLAEIVQYAGTYQTHDQADDGDDN